MKSSQDITQSIRDTYNAIAPHWHAEHRNDTWWIKGTDTFLSYLPTPTTIFDVGCGSGIHALYAVERGHHVVGIDVSETMILLSRNLLPQEEFFVMDMADALTINRTFSAIMMRASLLHIPRKDTPNILGTMSSCLAPGGYLYIAVKEKKNGIEEELKTEEDFGISFTRFFSYFSLDEIKEYMQTVSISPIYESITPSGRSNWIEVIGKKSS